MNRGGLALLLATVVALGILGWLILTPMAPAPSPDAASAIADAPGVTASADPVLSAQAAKPEAAMRVVQFEGQSESPYSPTQWPALPDNDAAVLSIFDTLRARAEQGDAGAACRLVLELAQCRDLESVRLEIERGQEVAVVGELAMMQGSDAKKDRARFLLNRCSGLGDSHFRAAYDLTKRAAMAGHRASLGRFLSGELFVSDLGHNIDHLDDFRRQAPRMLDAAIQSGSLAALSILANQPPGADSAVPEAVRANAIEQASLKRLWQLVLRGMQGERSQSSADTPAEHDSLLSPEAQASAEALAQQRLKSWFVDTGSLAALQAGSRKPFDVHAVPNMNKQCTEGYDQAPDPSAPASW